MRVIPSLIVFAAASLCAVSAETVENLASDLATSFSQGGTCTTSAILSLLQGNSGDCDAFVTIETELASTDDTDTAAFNLAVGKVDLTGAGISVSDVIDDENTDYSYTTLSGEYDEFGCERQSVTEVATDTVVGTRSLPSCIQSRVNEVEALRAQFLLDGVSDVTATDSGLRLGNFTNSSDLSCVNQTLLISDIPEVNNSAHAVTDSKWVAEQVLLVNARIRNYSSVDQENYKEICNATGGEYRIVQVKTLCRKKSVSETRILQRINYDGRDFPVCAAPTCGSTPDQDFQPVFDKSLLQSTFFYRDTAEGEYWYCSGVSRTSLTLAWVGLAGLWYFV